MKLSGYILKIIFKTSARRAPTDVLAVRSNKGKKSFLKRLSRKVVE